MLARHVPSASFHAVSEGCFFCLDPMPALQRALITDRQSFFASPKFLEFISANNIRVKLCLRDRHFNFIPLKERTISS